MRAVSEQFLAALRGSAKAVFRLDNNVDGLGEEAQRLDIIDGTVTLDGSADVRATLEVTIQYPWGDDGSNVGGASVTVYGDTLTPSVGLEFGNGNTEWVPLGVFRINDIDQSDVYADALRITAQDSACNFTDYHGQFLNPLVETDPLDYAIGFIGATWSYPDLMEFDSDEDLSAFTLGRQITVGGPEHTAWDLLKDIARSRGKILYFNHEDRLQIVDPPDPSEPVFTIDAGRNGVLVSASRSQTRRGVFNVVVAVGESPATGDAPYGYARDDNPASPTYAEFGEPFGQQIRWYFSPLLLTDAQCTAAARTILLRSLGVPYEIDLATVPNPALEPHDPVLVQFTEGRQELHIIDTVQIPLTPERPTMLTTRQIPFEPDAT